MCLCIYIYIIYVGVGVCRLLSIVSILTLRLSMSIKIAAIYACFLCSIVCSVWSIPSLIIMYALAAVNHTCISTIDRSIAVRSFKQAKAHMHVENNFLCVRILRQISHIYIYGHVVRMPVFLSVRVYTSTKI